MTSVEFFFDCSSPWTYLAFHRIQPMAEELGVAIGWKPILVGGMFNTVNPSVYRSRQEPVPVKDAYTRKDLQDWARFTGLSIVFPPAVFPVNSVRAMRGCIAAGERGRLVPFARAAFEVYWGENRDLSKDDVLGEVCRRADVEHDWLLERIGQADVKAALMDNTDDAIARGAFGTPSIFVDRVDMYFGNDRLELVREAVLRRQRAAA